MKVENITAKNMYKICSAFADYKYEEGENGLFFLFDGRQGALDYMEGFTRAGMRSGWLHTISDKQEGYIMISDPDSKIKLLSMVDLIVGLKKGLGFKRAITYFKAMKNSGTSLEKILKNEKKKFVQVEMLVVKEEYQNKGYMKKLLQLAFDRADELGVPCIVSTDGMLKAKKYEHNGFELYQKRQYGENIYSYDLIRYPKKL